MRRRAWLPALCLILLGAPRAWADPYARLAKALTKGLKESAGGKAAVVAFSFGNGRSSPAGEAVAARLQTELVRRGELKFVERSAMEKVLEELRFQGSGLVPAESALKAGKMSGADLLVTGTLTDLDEDKVEVNARLIRVETGELLRAAKETVSRHWSEAADRLPLDQILISLSSAAPSGASRRIGDRDLAFRYADQGNRPCLRVTDYTNPRRVEWTEVPIKYIPGENRYEQFSRDFHVAGREYRVWTDLYSNLKVAPIGGVLGRVDEERQVVLPLDAVFQGWIDDIERRSATLVADAEHKLIAYFETMGDSDMRVSLFQVRKAGGKETLSYAPKDVEVLKGRRKRRVSGRLLEAESKYFRVRYDADSRSASVEEVR